MLTIVTALPWEAARFAGRLRGRRQIALGAGWATLGKRDNVQLHVIVSGHGIERARKAAAALASLEPASTGILVTGVAGGLEESARPGDIVLAERVRLARDAGGRAGSAISVDGQFREFVRTAIERAELRFRDGTSLTVGEALLTPASKRAANHEAGAVAVQMEDHAWAEAARELGVPFASARAVLDPVEGLVPPVALVGEWRGPTAGKVARAALRQPSVVPTLLRLAWRRRIAVRSIDRLLESVAQRLTEAERS